ncbi:MAG TPA: AAA family ATPase, partial [Polyangiaceae bacterium LLY-WYZ-15_(1-7)]|nr:AAA family ATPase [Polyangiaceae bacterium LLY-WYZ-15_(1-7)]
MRSRAETAWVPRPELEEARSALAAADLVTLVGPPGIGKSRLARELLSDAPADETLFVDAASCADLAALRASLARALDLLTHDESEDAPRAAERLGRALCARGRPTVWLDDFEHLAEEAAETIARWRGRDAARFLITSRRPLRLRGERVISLAPLPTERADGDGAPSPASRLFLARAATARPGWSPDDADLARVEAIVARLEGIPLAIELAAARMHAMGTAEIARGLAHPLELSAAGPNDAARHATLRAAIVTSWELLRPWEQAALAQLSVFRAGFTLAAAEAVLALDEGAPWPMDVIQRLVEHSLVTRERRGDLPEARFRLYDGVRAFATEQLAERDPEGETRRRHAEALLARAEANVNALATEDGPQAARRLDAEREDLEHFAREGETAEARGRFALVLAARAELGGGGRPREALEAAAADLPESSPTRVRLTISLGHALLASGALREATHRLSEAWERARELGERDAEARALAVLASALWRLGEVEASELHARDALSIARAEGHRRATSRALRALASARMHVGALREALELLEEARAVDRALGDEWALGETLDRLGAVRKFLHQDPRAQEAWNEALAAHQRTGNLRWEAVTRSYLAELHVEAGEDGEAARELERAALAHAR